VTAVHLEPLPRPERAGERAGPGRVEREKRGTILVIKLG
jgi:hypothetical protein